MNIQIYLQKLIDAFKCYLQDLSSFRNLELNPLFWTLVFILFLFLLRLWGKRKSFSFCFILTLLLITCSKVERVAANYFISSGESYDPFIIRTILSIIILFVIAYYVFLKSEN